MAIQNLKERYKDNKYFNKRILTNERQQLAPRWASDMRHLTQVSVQQQKDINPDAIFGFIDPRDTELIKLQEMFEPKTVRQFHMLNKPRGSSAKRWNDTQEFATPNIIEAENQNHYKISHDNVQHITHFNPLLIEK